MCGIFGSINIEIDEKDLSLISHRGPDSFGLEKEKITNYDIYMGHRRLAIVDLSEAGFQPMHSFLNKNTIIFNGEIYNHLELRKELNNINFKGHSDTETILEYIDKNGISSINNFNGIFAFAYLDKKANKLFLARDPFGVKPLYYYHDNNNILFASELKCLKEKIDTTICKQNLSELLQIRYISSPDSLYKEIKKVKPGHFVEINLNNEAIEITKKSYIYKRNEYRDISYQNAKIEYGHYFEDAIKRQLMSDVEVGVLLSGGVDSAMVAYYAQKYSDKRIKAFTVGFEGDDDSDETKDAAETAKLLNLEHHIVKIGFYDFLETIKKAIKIVEEPIATTSIIPMLFLSEEASKYVKVVLTGQGADEPLGGYTRYQSEIIRDRVPNVFLNLIYSLTKNINLKNEKISRGLYSFKENDDLKRFLNTYTIFKPAEISQLIGDSKNSIHNKLKINSDELCLNKKKSSVEKMMSLDMRMNLSDDLLMYTDKITMHYSMEARVPILDHKLIEFIESLPAKYKVSYNKTKKIHKDFAKMILPEQIINRKKKGFQSPTKVWFRTYSDKIKEILLNDKSNFSKYFNLKYVENIINEHINGYNKEKQIFLLLSIYYTLEC